MSGEHTEVKKIKTRFWPRNLLPDLTHICDIYVSPNLLLCERVKEIRCSPIPPVKKYLVLCFHDKKTLDVNDKFKQIQVN